MPELVIRFKRHPDRSASLTCTRRDGSTTWQRQRGSLGVVFPPHDLTHYAVESVLGYRHGFYGLVADGWEIADFAAPWPRGPVPAEGQEVELIVGLLDSERLQGTRLTDAEIAEHAERFVGARRALGRQVPTPTVPQGAALEAVRTRRGELLDRWNSLGDGETMELDFTRGGASQDVVPRAARDLRWGGNVDASTRQPGDPSRRSG